MSYASDRIQAVKINALNGSSAYFIAITVGPDICFDGPREPVDEDDMDMDMQPQSDLQQEKMVGGYEITLVRRGYSSSPEGHEYDSEYSVQDFTGPHPCFAEPDFTDQSLEYEAAIQALELDKTTIKPHCIRSKNRI